MKTVRLAPTAARLLLGLMFTVFGLNFFLNFLPHPPMEGRVAEVATVLATSFVMATVKTVEVAAGLLLLSGRFVPLALALLAPIVVGIMGFHLTLAPATGAPGYLAFALELYLAYAYRDAFKPMLQAHVEPAHANEPRTLVAQRA